MLDIEENRLDKNKKEIILINYVFVTIFFTAVLLLAIKFKFGTFFTEC